MHEHDDEFNDDLGAASGAGGSYEEAAYDDYDAAGDDYGGGHHEDADLPPGALALSDLFDGYSGIRDGVRKALMRVEHPGALKALHRHHDHLDEVMDEIKDAFSSIYPEHVHDDPTGEDEGGEGKYAPAHEEHPLEKRRGYRRKGFGTAVGHLGLDDAEAALKRQRLAAEVELLAEDGDDD
jgi:hypothetical protein